MVSTSSSSFRKSRTSWTVHGESVLKNVVLVATRKPLALAAFMAATALSKTPSRLHGLVVALLQPIDVDDPTEGRVGFEAVELAFQQKGIGAEVNKTLAVEQSVDNFVDIRVKKRFAAGNGHHRRPAFLDGADRLVDGRTSCAGYRWGTGSCRNRCTRGCRRTAAPVLTMRGNLSLSASFWRAT